MGVRSPHREAQEFARYRASAPEEERTADLLALLPAQGESVLDVGSRDGHFSKLLAQRFRRVVALDLEKPRFELERVEAVVGDAVSLQFRDEAFEWVFCAEVLEHVSDVEAVANELVRVTRGFLVIGVPDRQDLRTGRTTCSECGRISPPWRHINRFDEASLRRLFRTLDVVAIRRVGWVRDRTNPLSTWLADMAGNPWGTYDQEEGCLHCGARLRRPPQPAIPQRLLMKAATMIANVQNALYKGHANWIHVLFQKPR